MRVGKGGGGPPLTESIKTWLVVRGARCILRRTPRRHRQCVVQWHLIRNNGPSSHILMVRGPYILDSEHYIALENSALVLESRIRIQLHSNVSWISTCAQAFILYVCVLRVHLCKSSEAQHPGRAHLSADATQFRGWQIVPVTLSGDD